MDSSIPRISIYISYHRNMNPVKSKIFKPIFVGAAIRDDIPVGMQTDSVGQNISEKNLTFCELTAQYWAWKNDHNSAYLGFFHYRRHLDFNIENRLETPNAWGMIEEEAISDEYLYRRGLYDSNLQKIIPNYDIITVRPWDVRKAGSKNNYEHYKSSSPNLNIHDYDTALNILSRKFPEYSEAAKEYNQSHYGYYTNIFVMDKQIFNEYCTFLFEILFDLEKKINISSYNTQQKRVFGYISEWLFGIFITHHKEKYKTLELNRTFISKPELKEEGVIPICMCSDHNYSEALGTAVASILKNKQPNEKIYIYLLDAGLSNKDMLKLKEYKEFGKSYFIHFIKVDVEKLSFLQETLSNSHLTLSTYYRLLLASSLPSFLNKVLYLDCDLIVRSSLRPLLELPMLLPIAGVHDVLEPANMKRLKLFHGYINAGVLLVNLKMWRDNCYEQELISLAKKKFSDLYYHDQDLLNIYFTGKIQFLENFWNAQSSSYPGSEAQNEIGKTSRILHYVSDRKPWVSNNQSPFQDEWLMYRKISPWGGVRFRLRKKPKSIRDLKCYPFLSRFSRRILPSFIIIKLKKLLKL